MNAKKLSVCCGTGCLANGSEKVARELKAEIERLAVDATVEADIKRVGCIGLCEAGPIVTIMPDNITCYRVRPDDAAEIVKSLDGVPVERLLLVKDDGTPILKLAKNPFYTRQVKIAMRNVGIVDPLNIDDYIARGGYEALMKALAMPQSEVISEVEKSKIRGRGGAGFPTGRKWRSCYEVAGNTKYMLCNGDEGDPGAFMDNGILVGDPHTVLEGMIIGARAIGANQGYFYLRDEYALAIRHVRAAIDAAYDRGYLGHNIIGSGFSFHVDIVRGGGAFVCGESSALMASIEGRVGEPKVKYIRSVEKGLFDKPTVLNNVETLANIPTIIISGGDWYSSIGTATSTGTKVFSLVGKVQRTGLVEVPMGITLREMIFAIGGGIKGGRPFKAVQTGGPSGGCIPERLLDLPIDFDSLTASGSMMGSGGMIVMDDTTCMVELAWYYVDFLAGESCGKCTPCREGLRCMLKLLTDICDGNGRMEDLDLLEELCYAAANASLCELGRSAPNPVLTTIKYFRDEYIAHIAAKRCPAGVCPALINYRITPDNCRGCGLCKEVCPSGAIAGDSKQAHTIDAAKCLKCGKCRVKCPFAAITVD